MPELPEVETIRRDLLPIVTGRTIIEAWVSPNAPRLVQLLPPEEFCRQISGRRIEDIDRRGKYLLFRLDAGLHWGVHLRMTGRLLHDANACPETPYLRAIFRLDDGAWLCFVDLRKFGTMWLVDDESLVTSKLGPEPLSDDFTPAYLHALLKRRSAPIKAALLDQSAIAGIGNIYADEALFLAGVSPRRAARRVTRDECTAIVVAAIKVMKRSIATGGSSISDYVNPDGSDGGYQNERRVYGREDEPCPRCKSPIRRVVIATRSSHFCVACQK